MNKEADVMKNPCKATKFDYDTHGCGRIQIDFTKKLAGIAQRYMVSLAGLFHHICLPGFCYKVVVV